MDCKIATYDFSSHKFYDENHREITEEDVSNKTAEIIREELEKENYIQKIIKQ